MSNRTDTRASSQPAEAGDATPATPATQGTQPERAPAGRLTWRQVAAHPFAQAALAVVLIGGGAKLLFPAGGPRDAAATDRPDRADGRALASVPADPAERVFTYNDPQQMLRTAAANAPLRASTVSLPAPAEPPAAPTRPADGQAVAFGMVTGGLDSTGKVRAFVNKGTVITTSEQIVRVNIASPDVADVNTLTPNQILVTAKKAGATQLVLWNADERSQTIDVAVAVDLTSLTDQIKQTVPNSDVTVGMSGSSVVVRGKVPDLRAADQVVALAKSYGEVVNLLEVVGGQQVTLQVRFMEVSRTALNQLGVDITSSVTNADFSIGVGSSPGRIAEKAFTLSGSGQLGEFAFEAFIDALKRNAVARVLAEPNLTVVSGQEGNFLAGGEVPIPVPQSGGGGGTTITIEYKEFGVKLKCTPVVLGDGRIRLKVAPEVSELDYENGTTVNGTTVPGTKSRKVETVVEMGDGQTFMLGGLLNRKVSARAQGTPLFGDLPVLGTLFRSTRFERSETELVILVTPKLVSPMNPDQVPAMPGEKWRYPNEAELYFNGDVGGPAQANRAAELPKPGGKPSDHKDKVDVEKPAPKFVGDHGFVEEKGDAPASQGPQRPQGSQASVEPDAR
jgi:pilus assembly protein CpaC